jgi:transposase
MTKIARVEDRKDLLKDMTSGALLSIDKKAAQEYREKKALLNSKKDSQMQLAQLKEKLAEIDELRNDLNEIKSLLRDIVNK